jgi:flavin-binding protein dodecin
MSVYRVTEIIGSSAKSWEDAAQQAVTAAAHSLRDLRVAEVVEQDLTISDSGAIESYRTKLRLSFKYEQPIGAPEWEGQAAQRPVEA